MDRFEFLKAQKDRIEEAQNERIAKEYLARAGDGKQQEARELGACDICGANGGECEHTNRSFAARQAIQPSTQPNVKLASDVIRALKDHDFLSGNIKECEEIVWLTLMRATQPSTQEEHVESKYQAFSDWYANRAPVSSPDWKPPVPGHANLREKLRHCFRQATMGGRFSEVMKKRKLAALLSEQKKPNKCVLHPAAVWFDGKLCPCCQLQKENPCRPAHS